jgi:hypothetical protein
MQKFLVALARHKNQSRDSISLEEFYIDLEIIEKDKTIWNDVTEEEIAYVRDVLNSMR